MRRRTLNCSPTYGDQRSLRAQQRRGVQCQCISSVSLLAHGAHDLAATYACVTAGLRDPEPCAIPAVAAETAVEVSTRDEDSRPSMLRERRTGRRGQE